MTDKATSFEALPDRCPDCGRDTEVGQPIEVTDRQQSNWVQFADGTRTIQPRRLPLPRRCTPCRWLFVTDPGTGKCLPLRS